MSDRLSSADLAQPTLLFMHALQWYEARLSRERVEQGLRPHACLSWGYLASQLFDLNSRSVLAQAVLR